MATELERMLEAGRARDQKRGLVATIVVYELGKDPEGAGRTATHRSGATVAVKEFKPGQFRYVITRPDGTSDVIPYWHPARVFEALAGRVGYDGWTVPGVGV